MSSFSYAAAALSQDLWDRLEAVSVRTIGVPVPGVEIKLVPTGAKQELRVRGPNVTPGYLGRPDLTEQAFDEDGFYRTGDARPCASMTVIPMSPRSVLFDHDRASRPGQPRASPGRPGWRLNHRTTVQPMASTDRLTRAGKAAFAAGSRSGPVRRRWGVRGWS